MSAPVIGKDTSGDEERCHGGERTGGVARGRLYGLYRCRITI